MPKPSLEIAEHDGVLVAEFWDATRLDTTPVHELKATYEARMGALRFKTLVIDLSGVTFAGSAALGAFVALQKLCRAAGAGIVFCRVEPTVVEAFRLARLDSLFRFVDTPEQAIRLAVEAPAVDRA